MSNNHSNNQNGVSYVNHQELVFTVTPLNSAPYMGSFFSPDHTPFPNKKKKRSRPAMVFLPSRPVEKDMKCILSATKRGVILTGSAALGKVGHLVGSIDIAESEDEYLFRVALPGVTTDKRRFSCEVEPRGKMVVKGVTATGERIVQKHSQMFEMQTQNLCPPGEFSVTFRFPGPVDNQTFSGPFFEDGILGGKIKKSARDVI